METLNINTDKQSLVNVNIGEGTKIFNFVNAYGCTIGKNSKVGSFVEIQKGVTIGNNCKISSHSFLCEGVHIENHVFIGHNVTFINDRIPRASNADGSIKTDQDWILEQTWVKNGASIGSSSTIMCGVTIGENAIVGAGSVVTKDVAPGTIVMGNPAKFYKKVSQ